MASCDYCGTHILFGGVKQNDLRFCKAECAGQALWVQRAGSIPEHEVEKRTRALHRSQCPRCGGAGPVDLHSSHWVYSALVFTKWSSQPEVCCRSCGRKKQLTNGVFSLAFGWWGVPFGLLLTPVQVARNFSGVVGLSGPKDDEPSPALRRIVRLTMARERSAARV